MQKIDLVIFDCDGVLIDSELISARMLVAELSTRGVTVDLAYVARHFLGRSYPVVLDQIRREFGVDLPDGFEADYRERLLHAFDAELHIMPGVRDVLDRLARPFCLATSSSAPRVHRSLEIVGLDAVFAGKITTASEVAHGKPAPDLFLRAAAKAGAEPGRCLVIEDSLNGIAAGHAAGMEVWRFTGGSHLKDQIFSYETGEPPDREFASFEEFFHPRPELRQAGPVA